MPLSIKKQLREWFNIIFQDEPERKPKHVESIQWNGDNVKEVLAFTDCNVDIDKVDAVELADELVIKGVALGDYILKDRKGQIYAWPEYE
jgi:hypothetical protein